MSDSGGRFPECRAGLAYPLIAARNSALLGVWPGLSGDRGGLWPKHRHFQLPQILGREEVVDRSNESDSPSGIEPATC